MAHLPPIVSDLAMILLVAGITTILFKKLNQPLVLGYIVAGFITGPHFSFFPTVTDFNNIHTWSEIGIIFLMFSLGLEFSFNKLKQVGNTAFIATIVENCRPAFTWLRRGHAYGLEPHEQPDFLGGMHFHVIHNHHYKAFEDLKMKGKRFTEMAFWHINCRRHCRYYHDGSAFHACCLRRHFRHGAISQRYAPAVLSGIVVCAWHIPCAYLL